ncbi:MAG TPA: M6 family metalloprotease domain-containing protein [Longimicrobiales bacterium]|nr:M6 family metalloprotease domain-containing protein [Longimicrobiales bacterium]
MPEPLSAQTPKPSPATGAELSPPSTIEGLEGRPTPPLEFSRAWLGKVEEVRRRRAELAASGLLDGMDPAVAADSGAALRGELRVLVIPVRYADVEPPFPVSVLEERLFGESKGDTLSFADYWHEVSGGLLRVTGRVAPWVKLRRKAEHYLPRKEYGWARFGRIGEIRREAIEALAGRVDFGEYDNDGPDGIPNSGDDDGYVDFVAFLYATSCKDDGRSGAIWPHRGAMKPMATSSPAAGGGQIMVSDYVVLSATQPGTCEPLHIGVLAHETGHALGLPDLYDYDGSSQGIGAWGLMGTGSHSEQHSPAHLSAWSKEQLGWVRVEWLKDAAEEHRFAPVGKERVVYRYDLPGRSGEYLLLENRQPIGSDRYLPGSGLLIWRINPEQSELGVWNTDERAPAVALIEAAGRADLANGRTADPSHPFPGSELVREFAYGELGPLRLAAIEQQEDGVVTANVSIGHAAPTLVALPGSLRITAHAGWPAASRAVLINREGGAEGEWNARASAPWLILEKTGDLLMVRTDPTRLAPGIYSDTVLIESEDATTVPARIAVDLTVVAPGVKEVVASGVPWTWGLAARDGEVFQASYAWDPLGLRPRPRLLALRDGVAFPETVARPPSDALFAPVTTQDGDVFVLAHARNENFLYQVDPDGTARLVAARLGSAPAYGLAAHPDGSLLVSDWSGRIRRILPDGQVETYAELDENLYQIATDSAGIVYAAGYSGNIIRIEGPDRHVEIPTGFSKGSLVAVTATPGGDVYAAERGGQGRILRLTPAGTREVITSVSGAQFFGLAVDEGFLYAVDLRNRNLLRIAVPPDTAYIAAERRRWNAPSTVGGSP